MEKKVSAIQEGPRRDWEEVEISWEKELDKLFLTTEAIRESLLNFGADDKDTLELIINALYLMGKHIEELHRYALALGKGMVFKNPYPKLLRTVGD